eukprot:COSAG01_NODE_9789_length_2343_cov_3.490642_5_plen_73_part_01
MRCVARTIGIGSPCLRDCVHCDPIPGDDDDDDDGRTVPCSSMPGEASFSASTPARNSGGAPAARGSACGRANA